MKKDEYIRNINRVYSSTRYLFSLAPADKLGFRPLDGSMTVAQLMKHCSECLGGIMSMAISGNWPEMPDEEMLPGADKMPKCDSAEEAVAALDKDWQLMLDEFSKISDEEFNTKMIDVPWNPKPMSLSDFMVQSFEHLTNHKTQLFIWLKLSGEKLDTRHLYGMHEE